MRTRAVTFAAKAAELRARAKVTRDVTARLGFLTAAQSYEMMARGAALEADREANATAWKDVPNPNWD